MKIAPPVAPNRASGTAPETAPKPPHTRCPHVHPTQCEQTLWSERPRGGLFRSLCKTIQSHTCKRLKAQKPGSAEPLLRASQKKTGEQAGGRRTFSDLGRINRRPGYGNGGHRRATHRFRNQRRPGKAPARNRATAHRERPCRQRQRNPAEEIGDAVHFSAVRVVGGKTAGRVDCQ